MNEDIKLSIAVIVGTVLLLAGIVGVVQLVDTSDTAAVEEIRGSLRNVAGNVDASNTIVEFSDLQCPACAAASIPVKQFIEAYGDRVSLEYRHFTLTTHANALSAAYAAESAGNQGKFWEVHDWLFENQKRWEDATVSAEYFYEQFGEELSLNKETFVADYASPDVRQRVADDNAAASKLRLTSTPTFYLDGQKRTGVLSFTDLVEAFDLTAVTVEPTDSPEPTLAE